MRATGGGGGRRALPRQRRLTQAAPRALPFNAHAQDAGTFVVRRRGRACAVGVTLKAVEGGGMLSKLLGPRYAQLLQNW